MLCALTGVYSLGFLDS